MLRKLTDKIKIRLQGSDIDDYQSLNDKKKSILLTVFFYLMASLLLFFITISIFNHDYIHILTDSSVLLTLSILYYLFRRKKKLQLTSYFFVLILCFVALFYVFTGGIENTGLIFIVLLPIPVIMVMGRKPGLLVLASFFLLSIIGLYLLKDISWIAKYPINFSMRIFISFIIISFLGYLNESVFWILYSRLQKTADSLRESREDFKSLSINREKFLSIISHDLKNQISGFYSATDLLKNNYQQMKEPERLEIINLLWESSQTNVRLLQDLLKWSMIKSDSFPNNPVNVKLEKIYKEVVELFDLEIEKKNLSVFLKFKSNSEVFVDYDMLSAIMRNLISNAIKFVGNNGEIRIKAEEQEDFMTVEVRDNGPGIDQVTLENLRQSILSTTITTGNEYGSGIGLLLVNEFVECSNGKLSIDSQIGKGTRISFTIPLAE